MRDGLHVGPNVVEGGKHDPALGVAILDRSLGLERTTVSATFSAEMSACRVAIGGVGEGKEGLFVIAVAMFCASVITFFTLGDNFNTASGAAMRHLKSAEGSGEIAGQLRALLPKSVSVEFWFESSWMLSMSWMRGRIGVFEEVVLAADERLDGLDRLPEWEANLLPGGKVMVTQETIVAALEAAGGNVSEAARRLGRQRNMLIRMMHKLK